MRQIRQFCYLLVFLCSAIFNSANGQIPTCTKNGVTLNVTEAEPKNALVYKLDCSDPNGDHLSYFLNPNGNTFKKFYVTNTGELRLNKTLNADFTYKYNLHITVTDDSPLAFSTTVLIGILVLNINDNDPKFKDLQTTINVREDVVIGTKLSTCSVTDKDNKQGALAGKTRVGIIKPFSPGARRWVLDSETCDFYVNTLLDYENKVSYKIGILAFDLDPVAPRTVTASVTINVIDVNDNYPKCTEHYKIVGIPEDFPVGATVTALTCTDADSGNNAKIFFKISDLNNQTVKDTFTVTGESGHLQLMAPVDYEKSPFDDINIDVYDGGVPSLTSTVIVGVVLADVDDNVPTWPRDPLRANYQYDVLETTPLGTVVLVVTANDVDKPDTAASTITYGLTRRPTPDWFSIDPEAGAVYVTKIMNWLQAPYVTMEVLAYSSNKKDKYNTVTLNISLIDENNDAPEFQQVFYQGNISESDPVGSEIFTVKAVDPEDGSNGQVGYKMDSPYFKVDPEFGTVTLKSEVDFETNTVFSLNIEAHDFGTPTQRGYTFLLINVLPVNEFTPQIIAAPTFMNIFENKEPGSILHNFTVIDDDDGFDGSITFFVQNTTLPFTIEPKTGLFRIGSQLDREIESQYKVVVIAQDDSESNPKSTSTTVTISLTDVNDNSPICEPLTNTVVKLGDTIGKILGTIRCTDADEGINAEFTYTKVSGDNLNAFAISPSTGEITLARNPTQTKYTLTILVEDRGDPKLDVIIAYNIIAELQFNFTNLPTSVHFPENTVLAYELIDIKACCVFSFIGYEILSGNEDNLVIIDPSSGKLILMQEFDRETKSNFNYTIKATSRDTNSIATSYINIVIEDTNDNSPKFDTNFQYIPVSEDLAPNTFIIKLTADDADAGLNSDIVFSIDGGNSGGAFTIDSVGNLRLSGALDAETLSQYSLIIHATDSGPALQLTGTATVVVEVKNVNEFSPEIVNIQNGKIETNVLESETLGAPVFSLNAEDKDINTVFSYSILQGNAEQVFVIAGSTGKIYLAKILDRETTDQYNLTVQASTDFGESVSAVIIINVLDVNDRDPKFAQEVYQLEVTHDDPADKLITTFVITDDDIGINQDIVSVTITDGDPNNHFRIDGQKILTKIPVDYYRQRLYSLTLEAKDGGDIPRSGFCRVVINVLPKFNPPKFLLNSYLRTVSENLSTGDEVFDLDATVDGGREGNLGTIRYTIRNGNEANDFYIADTTGIIRVSTTLDYEITESYILIIDAKSREDVLLSSSATLNINVQNINDHIPTFNIGVYGFDITEEASIGDSVGTVTASDSDKPPFGTINYSIESAPGSDDMSIDSLGVIKVAKLLEYRRQNVYNIPVLASDGGIVQGEALVVIRVTDVNNNAPTFIPDNLTIGVTESTGIGLRFYTVKAEDLDTGINSDLQYTLVSGNDNNLLGLDLNSGALTVESKLDRETFSRFNLTIRATDKAITGTKSGTLYLTINVLDANDNDPVFTKPSVEVGIKRTDAPGSVVTTVLATDDDIEDNAAITYAITEGNADSLFLLDVTSGIIRTASNVDTAENEYNLQITAKDQGFPSRSTNMNVKIQVRPFKVFGSGEQSMEISEGLSANQPVGEVFPKGGHDGSAVINYKIAGGNLKNSFQIDENTGMVSTLISLNREDYPAYILSIDVSDDNGVSYTKTVSINVLDINDNDPVITTSDTTVNVVENTPAGQIVAGFTVSDADEGPNAEVDISISASPALANFYFEIIDGFLVVKNILDYETTTTISLSVLATDRGTTKRTSSIDITVNVIDVTDSNIFINQPSESPSVYISIETSSEALNGEKVVELTAKDFQLNPTLTTTFTTLNREGIFSISETGTVTVARSELLQPEVKYFLWVVVTTNASDNKTSVLGLVRIDTFNPDLHLVGLESDTDAVTLEAHRKEMTASLRNFFSNVDVPKIWKIVSLGSTSRRKLLATGSESLVYVIKGPVSYDIADINEKKTFMDMESMLNTLRKVPNQDTPRNSLSTPNYPVKAVNGYSVPKPPTTGGSTNETFESSMDGYITFGLLGLLFLLIIILIIGFLIYKKKKRDKKRHNDSAESLVPPESTAILASTQKKSKKKSKQLPPISTTFGAVPTNKTTRRTSQGSIDMTSSRPSTSRNNTPSDIHPIFAPITPVQQSDTASPSLLIQAPPESHKASRLESIGKKVLPTYEAPEERKPSTIDPNNKDLELGKGSNTFTTNAPVVHRGKEYDGVGFDTEKQQRYAYNTRTGSTLWDEKSINHGQGKFAKGNNKKKAVPVIQVVSEAKSDFTPNLNMNRSIAVSRDT